MDKWKLQEARARLGEVIRRAADEGPQEITLHGRPAAVVLSSDEYRKLKKRRESFVDFMRRSPLAGAGIDLGCQQMLTRRVDIS